MYCVKCKKKTETLDTIHIITKNNKHMMKGICSICGKNKSSFVSKYSGSNLQWVVVLV